MNITVCVKVIKGELNPFDACAVECALQLGGEVTVVSMCPPSAADTLKPLTRLGVDRCILLSDKAYAGSDTLATSYILSQAVKTLKSDLIICGRQTVDGDTAQVGPCLATLLKYSLITNVMSIDRVSDKIECHTRLGSENVSLPALITVERINNLRFPRMGSKTKPVEIWDNTEVGADASRCGLSGSPTHVIKTFGSDGGERKCKFVTIDELLPLIKRLSKRQKAEIRLLSSDKKLDSIVVVGHEVYKNAAVLANNVVELEKTDAITISQQLKKIKPDAVLFAADLWGRKTAPQVSAMLKTGLCADCTALETDGKLLYMYRPAQSGNIIAKIKCKTLPQMATVRTESPCSDIIIAGGRGARENFEMLSRLSKFVGGEICASRAAVDLGLAPYEMQVGLTGKKVSPKVYVAVGISGAVHHTCAIEGASTVIAINTDKKARIFDYANYGIVCDCNRIFDLL